MCLDIRVNSKRRTAKKDITVYKALYPWGPGIKDLSILDSKSFKATIAGVKYEGVLSVKHGKVYLCQNSKGCVYSRPWDSSVCKCTIDGVEVPYRTVYKHFIVEMGKTYTSKLIKEVDEVNIGLHSYAKLKDVPSHFTIAKCIIPKGAKYYVGTFDMYDSYASDTLTYIEIIS